MTLVTLAFCLLLLQAWAQAVPPTGIKDPWNVTSALATDATQSDIIPNEFIVMLNPASEAVASVRDRIRTGKPDIELMNTYSGAIRGFSMRLRTLPSQASAQAFAQALKKGFPKDIKDIVPNQRAYVDQTLPPTGVSRVRGTSARGYNNPNINLGPAKIGIAIIDTGVSPHVDLVLGKGVAFVSETACKGTNDCHGHGTFCAGIAAGKKTGVAPGSTIYPVKVFGASGSGTADNMLAGMNWVATNYARLNIRVASMSLSTGTNSALQSAAENLARLGVVLVAAASNQNASLYTRSPAGSPYAVTVTAVSDLDGVYSSTDNPFYMSNYAPIANAQDLATAASHVVAAPGVNIQSTSNSNGYIVASGTSAATPHIAGLAARCFGYNYTCVGSTVARSTSGLCQGLTGLNVRARVVAAINEAANTFTEPGSTTGLYEGFQCDPSSADLCGGTMYYGNLGFAPNMDLNGPVC